MNNKVTIIPLALFLIWFFSCAYSFRAGSFPGTLAIPSLENNTANADIERILTDRLTDAFLRDGRVDIDGNGDFILQGVINNYERKVDSYTSSGEVEEYRINVSTQFSLTDSEKNEELWSRNIKESIIYSASEDETEGVEEVAERIKDTLLRIMLDSW